MKIGDIYSNYNIMPSLELHMLRVTAVAQIIGNSFNGSINQDLILTACLLHDMGNILKFNLDLFPEFLEPQGKDYWQKVKNDYKNKYGEDEHEATLLICREIGVTTRVIDIVDSFRFAWAKQNYQNTDFDTKIAAYADMRVEPKKVVPLSDRLTDGRNRFKQNKKHLIENEEFFQEMAMYLHKMEEQIFMKATIAPEDITDQKVTELVDNLRNFDIIVHKS